MRVTPVAYKLEQSIMGQKMRLGIICINFATQMGNIIFSIIFRKKTRNCLFPQCKKIQSSSVEDGAVKFACKLELMIMGQKMCFGIICITYVA